MRTTHTVAFGFTLRILGALMILPIIAPTEARAQGAAFSGAQATLIDPSARAWGMGRAGVAVFWGGDPNGWVNPALFGYHRGIRYEHGKNQLVPDLADDVSFTSDQITLGYWGIGLYMAGKPIKYVGGLELNYGKSVATDVDGNIIGVFTSTEKIQAIGVGFSVAELLENLGRVAGFDLPLISRYADVSLGQTWKSIQVDLFPASVTLDGLAGYGEADERDHGLLIRITPYNSIDYPGFIPWIDRFVRTRIDASYGSSAINFDNDATITYYRYKSA